MIVIVEGDNKLVGLGVGFCVVMCEFVLSSDVLKSKVVRYKDVNCCNNGNVIFWK